MTDDILYPHANKTPFHKKDFALILILKGDSFKNLEMAYSVVSFGGTPQINIRFWQCRSSARGRGRAVKSMTKKILTDDQAEVIAARVSFNLISDFVQPKLDFFFFRTLV